MNKQIPNLTTDELFLIQKIKRKTGLENNDNISRTNAYQSFFLRNKEIKWSFLASMVSRNAGYSMTDLKGKWLSQVLNPHWQNMLFQTYERANWLIFSDAYPQLLLYELSKKRNQPMFHLLDHLHVSLFMKREWTHFWETKEEKRLLYALIINEQNIIQSPVLEHHYYKKKVFQNLAFRAQDFFHFSIIVFPTLTGELYGMSANSFKKLNVRINLGKKLAAILFDSAYYDYFFEFACKTEHTGSRYDFEKRLSVSSDRETPYLRMVYPVVSHSRRKGKDWYNKNNVKNEWLCEEQVANSYHITEWYVKKQKEMKAVVLLATAFIKRK